MVKGDGDLAWGRALADCCDGVPKPIYVGGQIESSDFVSARWDLIPRNRYRWASVQTIRGCPKHCSFCSVWRTDGQRPRQRASDVVIEKIVQLRRLMSTRISTWPARNSRSNFAPSGVTACTCSALSSSAYPATVPKPSWQPPLPPSARNAPSRNS